MKENDMRGRRVRRVKARGVEAFVGADVEARTVGGGALRGKLEATDSAFLYLRRPNGRIALVALSVLTCLLDENRSTPQLEGE